MLLINTPGGGLSSSYKVARALRKSFDTIRVFVPHMAASGGTLVTLAGNEIIMGLMSNLGPLDPQIMYFGGRISARCVADAFQRYSELFRTMRPEEAPYPYRAMVDKLDPLLMEQWAGLAYTSMEYIQDILRLTGYDAKFAEELSRALVFNFTSHEFVLEPDYLRKLGVPIKDPSDYPHEWRIMRYWLGKYFLEGAPMHHIRFAIPQTNSEGERMSGGELSPHSEARAAQPLAAAAGESALGEEVIAHGQRRRHE